MKIYLDYAATTPVDPKVLNAMLPYFTEHFENAASNHIAGWEISRTVKDHRAMIANLIHANSEEIIFTSGATEANNLAIIGTARALAQQGRHIITCATEHNAVLDTCEALTKEGFQVTVLGVDHEGKVRLEELKQAITPATTLITIMMANNETGAIHPVQEIAEIAQEHKIVFHCDATQGCGKIPVNVQDFPVDLLSMSAHKMYGPKGIGALYVREKRPALKIHPIIHGGGHEQGMRSGTLNVPGIVGFGIAAQLASQTLNEEAVKINQLRQNLYQGIMENIDQVFLNGHLEGSLPGILNLSFAFIEGESLMLKLENIMVSTGSACTSHKLKSSHVLDAMGVDDDLINCAIRFSLGRFTTQTEISETLQKIIPAVQDLRSMSPLC